MRLKIDDVALVLDGRVSGEEDSTAVLMPTPWLLKTARRLVGRRTVQLLVIVCITNCMAS